MNFVLFFDFQSDEDMFAGMPPMAGLPNMPDPSEMSGGSKFDGGATKEVARYLLMAKILGQFRFLCISL